MLNAMLTYHRFSPHQPEDVAAMQKLLEAAPGFAACTTGQAVDPEAGLAALTALPPDKTAADKYVWGITQSDTMIGCIDLIRAYPTPDRAYLGLLLFTEKHQGKGFGSQALKYITQQAANWGCTHLRLGVVSTNLTGLAFWQHHEFVPLYQKPQAGYLGEIIVCERPIGECYRAAFKIFSS